MIYKYNFVKYFLKFGINTILEAPEFSVDLTYMTENS
jgi:hypothetical protein